jgi:threonine/homoserine/homoserine lactone efflux protein
MGILLGPLVLFAAVMSLTPGPNVVLVTASAANFGFGRTVPQMLGITGGFWVLVMAAGIGLAGLVHAEPRLQTVLRYVGGTYMLYLAWHVARADAGGTTAARAKPIGLIEAALFQWVNPKGWVFALGALAAYTPEGGDTLWKTSVITAILAGACLGSVLIWAGFGTAIGQLLSNPQARTAFNWSMAGLLLCSLLPVFW